MSEFYCWVNVDRKEFLAPCDFGYSGRYHGSMQRDGDVLLALYALLSDELEWKGDQVLFLGENCHVPAHPQIEILRILHEDTLRHDTGHYYDTVIETYWNRTAQFKAAENELRPKIEDTLAWIKSCGKDWSTDSFFHEYRIAPSRPFNALFWKEGRKFRYIINHTKRVYYDLSRTVIRYKDGTECDWADPLPILMAYGRIGGSGSWLGNTIGVGNEVDESYCLLKEIYLDW